MSLPSWILIVFTFFSLLFSLSFCLLWLLQGTFLLLEKSLAECRVKWQIIYKYGSVAQVFFNFEVTFFEDLFSMYHWPNPFYDAYFIMLSLYIMLLKYYFYHALSQYISWWKTTFTTRNVHFDFCNGWYPDEVEHSLLTLFTLLQMNYGRFKEFCYFDNNPKYNSRLNTTYQQVVECSQLYRTVGN